MSGDADPLLDPGQDISLFAAMLSELVRAAADAQQAGEGGMVVEQMTIDTAMEFMLAPAEDALLFDATGPSQTIETTILPVFHRVRATIALTEDGDG